MLDHGGQPRRRVGGSDDLGAERSVSASIETVSRPPRLYHRSLCVPDVYEPVKSVYQQEVVKSLQVRKQVNCVGRGVCVLWRIEGHRNLSLESGREAKPGRSGLWA